MANIFNFKKFVHSLNEKVTYNENSSEAGSLQKSLTSLGIYIGNFGKNGDGIDNIAGKFTFTGVKILLDLLKDDDIRKDIGLQLEDLSLLNFNKEEVSDEQEELINSLNNNTKLKNIIRNKKNEIEKEYKNVIQIGKPKRHVSKYIEEYGIQAVEACQEFYNETGKLLYPSVVLAQSALESAWGRSSLTRRGNNFFGIKANGGWKGDTIKMRTREVFNGKSVYVKSPFRKYDSAKDSFYDRNNFLLRNKRYSKNGVFNAETPIEQIESLKKAGYATAPRYVQAVSNILYSYNMDKYDTMIKK